MSESMPGANSGSSARRVPRRESRLRMAQTPAARKPGEGKPKEPPFPDELVPWRDKLDQYVKKYQNEFDIYLQYGGDKYTFVFTADDGFSFEPSTRKVRLSVPKFKEAMEAGGMTIDQYLFVVFHEMGHFKRAKELDPAGIKNYLAFFDYTRRKRMESKENRAEYIDLSRSYNHYYNILEDAIVNHMALATRHFGQNFSPESRTRHEQIVKMYTTDAFVMYRRVPAGEGQYSEQMAVDEKKSMKGPVKKVLPDSAGDLVILDKADYEAGFDWMQLPREMGRCGQFQTFFIKNQMIGLSDRAVYDAERNPNGKHILHEDAAAVFARPLNEAYPFLLDKIIKKYQNDPEQMGRYVRLLGHTIAVPIYGRKDGKLVQIGNDNTGYVVNPGDLKAGINAQTVTLASSSFNLELEKTLKELGITAKPREVRFLDIFNKFKEFNYKTSQMSAPLKHTMVESNRAMRRVLEPIFTMLCVLDDSFDVTLPEDKPGEDGEGSGKGKPGNPEMTERPDFEAGMDVRDTRNGRRAQVKAVNCDDKGNILTVEIEYYEPETMSLADAAKPKRRLSGETDEVFDPYKVLKAIQPKKDKQQGGGGKPPKYEMEEEEDEEPKEPKEPEEPEDPEEPNPDDEDLEDENELGKSGEEGKEGDEGDDKTPPGKPGKEPKGKPRKPKSGKKMDPASLISPLEAALRQMAEHNENAEKAADAAKERGTVEHQQKAAKVAKQKQLATETAAAASGRGTPENPVEAPSAELIKMYVDLEALLANEANEMAKAWLEIVNNIADEIDITREKFFRSGRLNVGKLQKYFLNIQLGEDMDMKLLYEQLVERIITELRPNLLKVALAIDNSGSMGLQGKDEQVRMAILLMNKSLASLRELFKSKINARLSAGGASKVNADLVVDTCIWLFGSAGNGRNIKPFQVHDYRFIEDETLPKPKPAENQETVDTIFAFQSFNCEDGDTRDNDMWQKMYRDIATVPLNNAIASGKATCVLLQFSDGEIFDGIPPQIERFRDLGYHVGGSAIGATALESLAKRHGDNTFLSNSPSELVKNFSAWLQKIVRDQVEWPMIERLRKLAE